MASTLASKIEYLPNPIKSESDKKDYRVLKLPNGLTALLIQDNSLGDDEDSANNMEIESNTEESEHSEEGSDASDEDDEGESLRANQKLAACSLCIGVGSFSDPIEVQGLAHFLEHMVFMGSVKYPEENDFDAFIHERGGSTNACTDLEHTTFFFEVQDNHLQPALDRFSRFLIDPLMKRDAIEREREAVESEFQMNLTSDSCRKAQLLCGLTKKGHPVNKFPWGNLITLRDNVNEDMLYSKLHDFRKRHYSAHRMTLAVQAKLSLDELERMVIDCFSGIPSNWQKGDDFSEFDNRNFLVTENFVKLYKIKPVKDTYQIHLTWLLPSMLHLYRSKPLDYLGFILGHEGKGSVISYLRKKNWCLEIVSGTGDDDSEHNSLFASFTISLVLTNRGKNCCEQILNAVFSYINLLRNEGPQKSLYDEVKQIDDVAFRFDCEVEPIDNVQNVSENMHFCPSTDYLRGAKIYQEYDPESIKRCIDALTPESVNIVFLDSDLDESNLKQVEPWFQTKYTSESIPKEWITHWKTIKPYPEFHLPRPNKFVPTDFSLIDLPEDVPPYPQKIREDDKCQIWYRPDPKFQLPDGIIYLYLLTPHPFESAISCTMLDLFLNILKQLLIEELYDASVADYSFTLSRDSRGITISTRGYSQKLPLLLTSLIRYFVDCGDLVTQELFDTMKKQQLKNYHNLLIKPKKLNVDVRLSILQTIYHSVMDKHLALTKIDFQQFLDFTRNYRNEMYIYGLAQGNLCKNVVLSTFDECLGALNSRPLRPEVFTLLRVNDIGLGERVIKVKNFNPADPNSEITNYYQSGITNLKLLALIEVILMIMQEPLFNKLRTQSQLAYVVYCELKDTYDILGYSITVASQANKFTCEYVDDQIEEFLQYFVNFLKELPKESFDLIKTSLIKLKLSADNQLKDEAGRNWAEIVRGHYLFDRRLREIILINEIEASQCIEWLQNHMRSGSNFKKLSIQVLGCEDPRNSGEEKIQKSGSNSDILKYELTYLIDEKKEKPADLFIQDISSFKAKLKPYNIKDIKEAVKNLNPMNN